MIEVFKTNIKTRRDALVVITKLKAKLPQSFINIDLYDCDKVLRVEDRCNAFCDTEIIEIVKEYNFNCEVLDC